MSGGIYCCMRCGDVYNAEAAAVAAYQCTRRTCSWKHLPEALWYRVEKPNGDRLYIPPEGLSPRARGIYNGHGRQHWLEGSM